MFAAQFESTTGAVNAQELRALPCVPVAVQQLRIHNKLVRKTYQAKVIAVSDGDTIAVLTADKVQIKIRFDSINATESGQPLENASKKTLSHSNFGKIITTVQETGTDHYKLFLAFI